MSVLINPSTGEINNRSTLFEIGVELDSIYEAYDRLEGDEAEVYPKSLHRENIASQTGQSPTSSGFDKNLSTLKSLGVVIYVSGRHVAATDLLFPEGLK